MNSAASDLERYLHTHIPLSRAMGVVVCSVGEGGVRLKAPMAPNVNHRGTVFGGSISALATLSAWAVVHVRLRKTEIPNHIVIQRNTVEYLEPIDGDFEAICEAPPEDEWRRFVDALARRGRARVTLTARLLRANELAGRFEGAFVATRAESAARGGPAR